MHGYPAALLLTLRLLTDSDLLVREVDQVCVRVLGAGAVEPLVAVLALEAETLPLVDRPDVLLQADLGGQLLPAYITHDSPAVLGLLVPETHDDLR